MVFHFHVDELQGIQVFSLEKGKRHTPLDHLWSGLHLYSAGLTCLLLMRGKKHPPHGPVLVAAVEGTEIANTNEGPFRFILSTFHGITWPEPLFTIYHMLL